MIAGQAADMDLCEIGDDLEAIEYIHLRRTAALISAASRMGALAGGGNYDDASCLAKFGMELGLAFQLVDDLLGVVGQSETIGKTPGKDIDTGKKTHIAIMGLEKAKALASKLTSGAIRALDPLDGNTKKIISLAHLLTDRTY